MEHARATWTDERLDDLSRRVDQGFGRVGADLRILRSDLTARFDDLQRLMIQLAGGTMATILATFIGAILAR